MIMRNRFDRQLALLDENMIRMGELCELAINRVIQALTGGSVEEARAVIEADDEIDHMETIADERTARLEARRNRMLVRIWPWMMLIAWFAADAF